MKRLLFGLLALVTMLQLSPLTAYADVNDFTISTFEADYYLSKDSDDRSQLKTVEKITAEFPGFDQNHGIERAIPQQYDGHSTHVDIKSVTNPRGSPLPYSTYTSNDNLVVRIGDKDTYAHGSTTYVITYTQRDVTRYFANTKSDEFYWDTNGTEWAVPITNLITRVHLADNLTDSLTGQTACYQGYSGASDTCQLKQIGGTFVAAAVNLQPHQNMSLSIGFQPDTFAAYQPSLFEQLVAAYIVLLIVTSVIALGLIIWLSVRWSRQMNRKNEMGTIIPEYLPPPDTSVSTSAAIMTRLRRRHSPHSCSILPCDTI